MISKHWKNTLASAIVAMLLGGSLALMLCDSMSLPVNPIDAILPALITALCCGLMSLGLAPMLATLAGLAALAGCAVWQDWPIWQAAQAILNALLRTGTEPNASIADNALLLLGFQCALLTAVSYMITQVHGGVYPAIMLTAALALGSWIYDQRLNVYYILPALCAIVILFARSSRDEPSYARAAPLALAAVLIAALAMPWLNTTNPTLEQHAGNVRGWVNDYLLFSEQRTLYSLKTEGYQQNGELMGGDASPSDYPIMSVKTDTPLLLRGAIKRDYTGSAWVDNTVKNRNLFTRMMYNATRSRTFGLDMPAAELLDEALRTVLSEHSAEVTFLSRGTSTLFVPHRLTSLETDGENMVPYFNTPGELFITRSIRPGDSYKFSAYIPDTNAEAMDEFLQKCANVGDTELENVYANYMSLPTTLNPNLSVITQNVTSRANTPFQKALAIQNYLRNNFTYTLTPGDTPSGSDFVSYFLLESRKGYCTYFASAMGVMARLAGLPSRYVEGYLVRANEEGVTEVTGKDAHAWVEIYFAGFGWVSFDPTPASDNDAQTDDNSEPNGGNNTGENRQATPPPDAPAADSTPEPTEQSGADANTDSNAPAEMPTPTPDMLEPVPPADAQPPDTLASPRIWLIALITAILALLALAAIVTLRLIYSQPERVVSKLGSASERLLVYYRATLTALEMQGQSPQEGETPALFAKRIISSEHVPESFARLTNAVVLARYANATPTADDIANAAVAYNDVVASLHIKEKLRWYKRRVRHGLGNLRQIP